MEIDGERHGGSDFETDLQESTEGIGYSREILRKTNAQVIRNLS